jgi:hypothetical protein
MNENVKRIKGSKMEKLLWIQCLIQYIMYNVDVVA